MDTLTTRDTFATRPILEDEDIRSALALAPSDPEPQTDEQTSEERLEAFLRLARAH